MKVLAYTSPARGNLYPVVPILTALHARGHEACAVALAGELPHLRALGIEATAIAPAIAANPLLDWRERSLLGGAISVLRTFAERATDEAPDLAHAIAYHRPDVLLIDTNCWGAAVLAESSGLPWAFFSTYLPPLRSREAPPFGLGLRPIRGPLGRIRDATVRLVGDRVSYRAGTGALNALRSRYSLAPVRSLDELLRRAPLLLALTAEGFEYPREDWPASVRFVGPMNWTPPIQAPAWLEEMPSPLVLVTCSTERQSDRRLIEVALQSLPAAGMPVLATSAAHDPEDFAAPAGSRVARFVPHDAVLQRASCVVCHGGLGITQKALSAGVPVVVVPFGRDQLETARRVEHAEAGVRLSPRRLNDPRLVEAVRRAIARRDGARRVAAAYARAGGPRSAADAIEALAAGRATRNGVIIRPCSPRAGR